MTTISNHNRLFRLVVSVDGVVLNEIEDFHSFNDLTEDDMSTIKMRGSNEAEEELGAVGSWASVGHGEDTTSSVLVDEVLVSELTSVDGGSTGTVMGGEIATLGHEISNDSVEGASFEVKRDTLCVVTLLTSAESAEVLGSLGGVGSKFDLDSACGLTSDGDVEEDLGVLSHNFFF